jgi:hypothetical protein
LLYPPFDDALDEFLRKGPVGAVPETIRASDFDWRAFRQLTPDETYEGIRVERAGGSVTSVRGRAPDWTSYQWPPSQ